MTPFTLRGGRLVTPEGVIEADLVVEDGIIAAIGGPPRGREVDLAGDLLLPGLVDLHGDAIEKEVEPRPGALFPFDVALTAIDRRLAAAGITTAFHGISFAQGELGVRDVGVAERLARAVHTFAPRAAIDHRVHLRFEVTDAESEARVEELLRDGVAALLSFMDHTPGQGQFKTAAAYAGYLSRVYETSAAEIERRLRAKIAEGSRLVARMERLASIARDQRVAIAGHDDEGSERIALMARLGARVSEFPIDLETARAAHDAGLLPLFGAPNLLRGRSQSGALSARLAVAENVAGGLCSDYAPQALLPALGVLTAESGLCWSRAIELMAAAPARAVGLDDRGRIAEGMRADLVRVRGQGATLAAVMVWVAGVPVYRFGRHAPGGD